MLISYQAHTELTDMCARNGMMPPAVVGVYESGASYQHVSDSELVMLLLEINGKLIDRVAQLEGLTFSHSEMTPVE